MKLLTDNLQLHLPKELVDIIQSLIEEREYGCIISFRDPGYSAETGGFHPVEMYVDEFGQLHYITDFAYLGAPPFSELVKELDFDFELGLFQHNTIFGSAESPIIKGQAMFRLWSANFVSYYSMGVYTVEIREI